MKNCIQRCTLRLLLALLSLPWCAVLIAGEHPSEVFVKLPADVGTVAQERWISSYGGDTWEVHPTGIVSLSRSRVDSGKIAVAWTDFVAAGTGIRIEGAEGRAWPVRIMDKHTGEDIDLQPYGHLRVYGLSHIDTCYLIVEPRGGELRLGWHGPHRSRPHLHQRGHDVVARAGVPVSVAFPALPSAWLAMDVPQQEEPWEPVIVTDPRVLFATYLEPHGSIGFDRRGDLLMSGQPPLLRDVIPITPELVDDSVSLRFGRTTKLTADRRTILWSVWAGGGVPTVMAQNKARLNTFDRNNNLIVVNGTNVPRKLRSHGTYQESPAPNGDIMIQKWSPEGRLLWNTYVGGNAREDPWVVVTDDDGNIYVGGRTMSTDFPTPNGLIPVKPNHPGRPELFVFSLSPDGKRLRWGTYFGARDAVKPIPDTLQNAPGINFGDLFYDGHGGIMVSATQGVPTNFPILNGWQSRPQGGADGLLARFGTDGSLKWSTYVATPYNDWLYSITRYADKEYLLRMTMLAGTPSPYAYPEVPDPAPIPCFGVPGHTHTPQKNNEVYMRFTLDGALTFLWAPLAYQPDYSFMAGPDILIGNYLNSDVLSSDGFVIRPNFWKSSSIWPPYPAVTIARMDGHRYRIPLFSPFMFGVGTGDRIGPDRGGYVSTHNDFIVGGSYEMLSRGACLTDTLWGAGFGTNEDRRAYAMCFRSPVALATSVASDDSPGTTTPALQIAPHPVQHELRLDQPMAAIVICDVLGAERVRHSGPSANAVPVQHLPAGLYILQAVADDGTLHRRTFLKE